MDVPVAWGSQSATTLDVGALRFIELRFPSALVLPSHEHDRPTLAVVMKGSFETRLASDVLTCGQSSLRVEPAGSTHTNRFGPQGAHIVVVQPDPRSPLLGPVADALSRAHHRRDPRAGLIGRAIASEFRHRDAVSPLALQGLGLELVAALARSARLPRSPPPWLAQATELIHDRFLDRLRIETIADAVGVRPSELVRAFRAFHGVPIGSYARRLRLEWVARRLAESDEPIISVAHDAGFADQPHLTRAFRAFSGLTPARYRRLRIL
ncbi:MAG: AraC family transcriptional regulator [Candidatus Limnocylindria bacterium]